MDVVLLHNPQAGDAKDSRESLVSLLQQHGYRPTCFSLDEALSRTDPLPAAQFVIVAGGDGSIKSVATHPLHRHCTIAPLPMGTANNIATSLGVKGEPADIVARWRDGRHLALDLGVAQGPWGERWFIEGIGIGLIGRAIATMEAIDAVSSRSFSRKEDKLYRDLCVLLALAREIPPVPLKIQLDGQDRSGDYLLFEGLNIDRAGPGFELAAEADPADGRLHVASVRAHERPTLTESLSRCLGELEHARMVTGEPAQHLKIELTAGEVRLDDEVIWPPEGETAPPPLTLEIRLQRGAVRFLLPAAEKSA